MTDPPAIVGEVPAMSMTWKNRAGLFLQRFWQPTSACMTCMPGSLMAKFWSGAHWSLALQTGLVTGVIALALSYTPVRRMFADRLGNAVLVGCLTAFADVYSHPNHYGAWHAEALLTGAISFVLAWFGSFLFEDRARRVRAFFGGFRRR